MLCKDNDCHSDEYGRIYICGKEDLGIHLLGSLNGTNMYSEGSSCVPFLLSIIWYATLLASAMSSAMLPVVSITKHKTAVRAMPIILRQKCRRDKKIEKESMLKMTSCTCCLHPLALQSCLLPEKSFIASSSTNILQELSSSIYCQCDCGVV